jgi:hypothetical protein
MDAHREVTTSPAPTGRDEITQGQRSAALGTSTPQQNPSPKGAKHARMPAVAPSQGAKIDSNHAPRAALALGYRLMPRWGSLRHEALILHHLPTSPSDCSGKAGYGRWRGRRNTGPASWPRSPSTSSSAASVIRCARGAPSSFSRPSGAHDFFLKPFPGAARGYALTPG